VAKKLFLRIILLPDSPPVTMQYVRVYILNIKRNHRTHTPRKRCECEARPQKWDSGSRPVLPMRQSDVIVCFMSFYIVYLVSLIKLYHTNTNNTKTKYGTERIWLSAVDSHFMVLTAAAKLPREHSSSANMTRPNWPAKTSDVTQAYTMTEISPNSTWLVTSRLYKTQHVRRVDPVELFVTNVSSRAIRQVRSHSQNAWARHVERVESCREMKWRVKWNLVFTIQTAALQTFHVYHQEYM